MEKAQKLPSKVVLKSGSVGTVEPVPHEEKDHSPIKIRKPLRLISVQPGRNSPKGGSQPHIQDVLHQPEARVLTADSNRVGHEDGEFV